jgi:hypothetical protein
MGLSVNDVLKLALAGAILLPGIAVADYYMVYLPHKDELAEQDAKQARIEAQQRADAERNRQQQIQQNRRTAYNVCVSNADFKHTLDWNLNCTNQAKPAKEALDGCLAASLMTAAACRQANPVPPEADCGLPTYLASAIDSTRDKAKEACLAEAQSGIKD